MNSVSRRDFGRLLGVGTIAATLPPVFAQTTAPPKTSVRLSANENPFGPSSSAMAAMRDAMRLANRYPDDEFDELIETVAKVNGVAYETIKESDGSLPLLTPMSEVAGRMACR